MVGAFSYRFSGFSMNGNTFPYHIVGLGLMNLNADGTLDGRQRSSITRLWGSGATLENAVFTLKGRYEFDDHGLGHAAVTFSSDDQELEGGFDFVVADSVDRFWLISSGAAIVGPGSALMADEVVSGEAVRMGLGPI
jgi:hypothetical protein